MGRKRKNLIYDYYNYNSETNKSKCKMEGCQQQIRGHHAGNLLRHFYTQHRVKYNKIIGRTCSDNDNNINSSEFSKVMEYCINLVAVHGRPLSLLQDEAFQGLISMIPNKGMTPNISNVKISIETKAYAIRNNICNELKNQLVCLKIDVASVKSRRFLGINVQFISGFKIQLRNLGVIELHRRNTAAYLKDKILMILSRYGIKTQQLYSITSDNGANMLAMSRQIAEIIKNAVEDISSDSDNEDTQIDISLENSNEVLDMLDRIQFERETAEQPTVTAVRCAAHTLQLAVHDACKESQSLFESCRRSVRILRTPNVALELKGKKLPQAVLDCPTRWDSTADMLERLLGLKEFCEERYPDLIENEIWTKAKETLEALQPCRILSKRLQEQQLTFGDFYIAWVKCLTELEQCHSDIAMFLVKCMRERELNLLTNDTFLSAIYLDPRVNSILSDEQSERARNHLIHTYQRYNNLQMQHQKQPEIENDPNQGNAFEEPNASTSMVDIFFASCYSERQTNRPTETSIEIKNALINFLNQPRLPTKQNVLKYWFGKKFTDPLLYYLSNIVLATPPTQVSVERLFSSLKFVLNNLRMSLRDSIIDDILVVRNNYIYEKQS